ncbi:MAG: protein kinase domain-containing protein, partial [Planctomycetota bacterium]
ALADRYRIERELGRGGMATVYLAEDLKHHRQVAIKVLKPELTASLGAERFLREITIAAKLHHPNILMLIDSGDADGFLYYVMPYVEGESLRDRLTREPQLPLDEAVAIARDVAEGLDHAHAQDIVHRDIKPENILFDSGRTDFGVARAVTTAGGEKLTETGIAIGTPHYMSPEQASGAAAIDSRADIYALGCVVYEMLGGDPPFTGSTPQAILSRQVMDTVPNLRAIRRAVAPATQAVIEKALEKSPADRFGTAEEFGSALRTSLTGEWVVGPPPPGAWYRRPVTWVAAVGLIAMGLTAGVVSMTAGPDIVAHRVAVAPFVNQTGDPSHDRLGVAAADRLATMLAEADLIHVVLSTNPNRPAAGGSRGANGIEIVPVQDVLPLLTDSAGKVLDRASPAEVLAAHTAAGLVVVGSYRSSGGELELQAQLIDTKRGLPIYSSPAVVTSGLADQAAVDELGQFLGGALAALINPVVGDVDRTIIRAPRLDALAEYRQGLQLYQRRGFPAAAQALRRAIERDSTFVEAYFFLANGYWVFNRPALDTLVSRLNGFVWSARDAHLVNHVAAVSEANWNLAFTEALEIFRIQLDGWNGTDPIGNVVARDGMFSCRGQEAVDALKTLGWEAHSRQTYTFWYSTLAGLHLTGDYEEELRVARYARELFRGLSELEW